MTLIKVEIEIKRKIFFLDLDLLKLQNILDSSNPG